MNWTDKFSWWSAMRSRRVAHGPTEHDLADMGTAFGLDASLAPIDLHPPATRGAQPEPSVLPWAHRLTRRSSL